METRKKTVLLSKSLVIETAFGSALEACLKHPQGLISQPTLGPILLSSRALQSWPHTGICEHGGRVHLNQPQQLWKV